VNRRVDERDPSGGARLATRLGLASIGSRPPAVAVLVVALLVAGTVVASVVGTLSLARGAGPAPPLGSAAAPPELATPPAGPAADPTDSATDAAPTPAPTAEPPAPPSDPRSVFQDEELRTLAAPFLAGSEVSCAARAPAAGASETVSCDLGDGRTALFSRFTSPDVMRDQRRGFVTGRDAEPGTVLSVRWRYGARGEATRAGIPPGQNARGEGVRVRFVDGEGLPRLYFDQDSCGCAGDIALTRPTGNDRADLEALREYWADPAG
jgi:hypothetical protein